MVSVHSAPTMFILPRLSKFDERVIVLDYPCKCCFGGLEIQTDTYIYDQCVSFALKTQTGVIYITKYKIGSFCPGLPYWKLAADH